MIRVGIYINGITLNDYEWLLNNKGNIKWFKDKPNAIKYLKLKGFTEEEIYYLVFKNKGE
jgi:hypothetical protein